MQLVLLQAGVQRVSENKLIWCSFFRCCDLHPLFAAFDHDHRSTIFEKIHMKRGTVAQGLSRFFRYSPMSPCLLQVFQPLGWRHAHRDAQLWRNFETLVFHLGHSSLVLPINVWNGFGNKFWSEHDDVTSTEPVFDLDVTQNDALLRKSTIPYYIAISSPCIRTQTKTKECMRRFPNFQAPGPKGGIRCIFEEQNKKSTHQKRLELRRKYTY